MKLCFLWPKTFFRNFHLLIQSKINRPNKRLAGNPNLCETETVTNKTGENPPKRNYQWPWIVGAAVMLGIVLAIVWMSFAVRKVERERDFNAPLPNSAPAR